MFFLPALAALALGGGYVYKKRKEKAAKLKAGPVALKAAKKVEPKKVILPKGPLGNRPPIVVPKSTLQVAQQAAKMVPPLPGIFKR